MLCSKKRKLSDVILRTAVQSNLMTLCDLFLMDSCKSQDAVAPGCAAVSGGLPADIRIDLDTDREMERIHSLFFNTMEKLEKMQGTPVFLQCLSSL